MEPLSKPMEQRIHMVRTWLDAAAKSYAMNAKAKGNLHLLLAQAEMKHMNEGKPSILSYVKKGTVLILCVALVGLGHLYYSQPRGNPVDRQAKVSNDILTKVSTPTVLPMPVSNKVDVEPKPTLEEKVGYEEIAPSAVQTAEPPMSSSDILGAVQAGGRILRD